MNPLMLNSPFAPPHIILIYDALLNILVSTSLCKMRRSRITGSNHMYILGIFDTYWQIVLWRRVINLLFQQWYVREVILPTLVSTVHFIVKTFASFVGVKSYLIILIFMFFLLIWKLFSSESTIRALCIFKALTFCHSCNANINLHNLTLDLEKLRNLGHLNLSPSSAYGKCHLGEIVERKHISYYLGCIPGRIEFISTERYVPNTLLCITIWWIQLIITQS